MPSSAQTLGAKKDTIKLKDDIFGQPFNGPLVHECVIAELAARRQGTHSTKTRGMVSGGGAKPWRQKGTGRARAGSSRSPIWTGGGTVFGPSPRRYTVKVNRKARRAALRSALSAHAQRGSLFVLAAETLKQPSTKEAAKLLADIAEGSVLIVLGPDETVAAKSFRNLAEVEVVSSARVGIVDLVAYSTVVMSADALSTVEATAARSRESEKR